MKRELSKSSRRIRTVTFFVAAGLLLSGCVRVTYNATLNANGTMSGTIEELLPDSVVSLYDDMNAVPRVAPVANFSYSGWSVDSVAHTCTLANPEVRIDNSRFDTYQPDSHVVLYGLGMANDSDAEYYADVAAVVTETEDTYLLLKDIVITSECPDPGQWVEGGRVASSMEVGDIFGVSLADEELLTAMSNIPAVDKAYMFSLFLFEIEGAIYPEYVHFGDDANQQITEILNDAADHRLAAGEFPARLAEIDGIKPVRRDGSKGLAFTFSELPLASASDGSFNFLVDGPNFQKVGSAWMLTMDYPDINGVDDLIGAAPTPSTTASARLQDRTMDAFADMAADHSFTVNGVVLETNGDYNATDNSVDFGFYLNAMYQSVSDTPSPVLTSVLGTTVKFTYKKKSLSKDGKAAVKGAKSGLLRAKKITIVGILDGTKTSAGDKRKVKLLAQARAKALGKYLAKLGVTAKIKYSYSTLSKNNIDAVVKAGQRRAVIQITQ